MCLKEIISRIRDWESFSKENPKISHDSVKYDQRKKVISYGYNKPEHLRSRCFVPKKFSRNDNIKKNIRA